MSYSHKPTVIETIAEKLHLIPDLHREESAAPAPRAAQEGAEVNCPPPSEWDNWIEYDSKSWPERKAKNYMLVPTACFNCEAG
ncbi:MAG: hypothetical protein HGB20_07450, partial [Chlorobiaceae bacterium]|nr:hypothetical protein [Chlorobiaceae bacterium]